ncbi:MAG: PEP/pyruvate-binding domain-containing protein, partial [Patescibacteria group bacterium]
MAKPGPTIVWLEQVDKADVALVGGKAANLGELIQAGIPVPPAFVVTTESYQQFVRANRFDQLIRTQLGKIASDDTKSLQFAAMHLQEQLAQAPLPAPLAAQIREAYQELVTRPGSAMQVAVRSSVETDGVAAGDQLTVLNVTGAESVIEAVRSVFGSLFAARAVYYRATHGLDHLKATIAVVVQSMVQSEVAGNLFTLDPLTKDKTVLTIDAAWGLGEAVTTGALTPDRYRVHKDGFKMLDRQLATQAWKLARKPGTNTIAHMPVAPELQSVAKLTDAQLVALAAMGQKIEDHFQFP